MDIQHWWNRRRRTHEETTPNSPPSLERLEPRVLLNADPLGASAFSAGPGPVQESAVSLPRMGEQKSAVTQLLFVDAAVPDTDVLMRGLSLADGSSACVVRLDAHRDGVAQITEALADCRDLAAIHIFSHGARGSLLLGNAVLDAHTIEKYAGQLRDWGAALAEEGDILLYGCSVGAGEAGADFLDRLGALTGADIAASDDPTGSTALLGDWNLESVRGTMETAPAFGASGQDDYAHVLLFTLVVLPDTQKYAEQQLQPFLDQTQWIADHAVSNNIAFVSHVGDVVENGALYESEWVFADAAMDVLDGTSIPYSVLPGNHDYDIAGTHSTINRFAGLDANGNPDPALADKSFGASRYEGQSWFVGASDDALNYCQIFTADGQDYLHLALEWEPRPSSVAWAQQQIDAYPQLPVILSTHYYIDPLVDGHFLTTYSDDGLNGEELFQALVYPNPQIFLVLSGHNTEWHRVATNAAGFEVIETMTDYQSRPNGGNGWMQLFTFDPDLNQIGVQTYSPTLDQFEVDANSQFSFSFDFNQRFNFILAPTATLVEPVDQGPEDKNPAYDAVLVNTEYSRFRIQLMDANDGVDDMTVTNQALVITRDGATLTESVDYSFNYDPTADRITLTPIGGDFSDGLYEITFNNGTARIADVAGNELTTDLLTVQIDTSIPHVVTFQQGVYGYAGTVDTDVRGSTPDSEYSAATSIRSDAENSGSPIHGLLRFDDVFGTGPGQIPAGAQILSAQLEFAVTDNGNAVQFCRMLRGWAETETWNSLGDGIQANGIEAVSVPDATTGEVVIGTLSFDVTASLIAWATNPTTNLGWAILPLGSNGVMLDSSEGTTPPKLTVTFSGTVVDTTSPTGTLVAPLDQGPSDLNPTANSVTVSTAQPYFELRLEDLGRGIDVATVTSQTVVLRKDDVVLADSIDYSFSYSPATARITLTSMTSDFSDGHYEIILNGEDAKIADVAGNNLVTTTLTVEIDTSIPQPQTVTFQQGINGYLGTVDTDVRGSTPDAEYSTTTSIRADAENSGSPIHGLLRFDDVFGSAPGQIPIGAQIMSAHLEFHVTDNGNPLQLHRMLRGWADTETWNTLGAGIQADGIEAVSSPDTTTTEVVVGTLALDVTASLIAWANDPSGNLGWAFLPIGPNGVMLDSSEGATPPKLIVTFNALSANNAPPTVALDNPVTSLAEKSDTTARIKVADIVVTDDESGTNVLSVAGADASLFEIDGTSLYLKAGAILDHETNPTLDVTVEVNDPLVGLNPDDTAHLAISITDVNEPPTLALVNPVTTLPENTDVSVRVKIADIIVTDDALGTNVLSLTGTDAALFEIEGAVLYLKAGTPLDMGTNPVLDVTVAVDDAALGSTPDAAVALAIQVTEVNNAPTVDLINVVTTLPEDTDTSARIKIADIVVTDDAVGTEALNLNGTDAALFEIDGTELYLKAGSILDYETNPTLDVTVEVDDPAIGANPDDTAALTISITDINEPPILALANAVTNLPEDTDTSARIKVADVIVTDDALGTNVLTLTGADAALFEIEGTILYLKAGTSLDMESNPVLNVTVELDDPEIEASPDAAVALAIAVGGSTPQTVTFQQGIDGYTGTVDTDVQGSTPDAEYSADTSIRADAQSGGSPIHGLLRFENIFGSALGQIPVGAQINSAWLEFHVTDNGNALRLHRMLRDWAETETWNTLGAGIQATDVEAVSTPDATTAEVTVGTLSIDVTASLIAWASNPSSNFGWAILPLGSNGVMLDSSEGATPPKLTVTFGGTVVDATSPTGTLVVPLDQGPNDLDPAADVVCVNTAQPYLQVRLEDVGEGIDDTTVTAQTVILTRDGILLTESVDYSFSYDPAAGTITLTPLSGTLGDGLYQINVNSGASKIADLAGNPLATTLFTVTIDTSISLPQTVIFQQGVNGYAGTLDTDVRGSAPDAEYSTAASIRADAENGGSPIHGLLRFDDIFGSAPGQIPSGAQITSARLEFRVSDNGNALQLHRMLRDWAETETWNTLGAGIQATDVEAVSTPDAMTAEVAVGTLLIDVTASLIAWAGNPSSNLGWALLPTGPNGVMLDSSEGATPPRLIVTFTTSSSNNPPTVALENTLTTLAENADTSARIKVANVVVTDDGVGTNTLSLNGADAALFEIEGTELYLKAGTILDYETNPVLDVIVEVDDAAVGSTPDATAALAIAVTDVNNPPTVALENALTTLAEDTDTSTHIKVANVVVTDDGVGTNTLSLSGTDAALFEIEGTGLYLKAGTILDYETNPVLDVIVEVDDAAVGSTPDGTAAFAIAVTDANDPPTVALENTLTTLAENADTSTHIKVANVVVTDDGVGTNALSLNGADAALFEIEGTELYLKAGTILDYETNPVLDVIVEVDDAAVGFTPDATAALAIAVTDVNNPPTVALENTLTTLAEDTDTSTHIKVADVVVTDDGVGTNVLSLSGGDAALFEIEGTELYLKAGTILDYETNPVLDVIVKVDDAAVGSTPDATAALVIAVTDANDPPTVALENTLTTLAENADTSARIKVADVVVTDDGVGTNLLSLSGTDAALFEIEGTGLYLKAGTILDYETNPLLDVTVAVDDHEVGTSPDGTASLAISITPVVEQQTLTFQQGVDGYTGTLDTDIRGDAPDNQYSTSVSVKVDGNNVAYPIQALLRFDNIFGSEPDQIPARAQILSASLELTVTDAGSALTLHRLLRSWAETETWNTLGNGIQTDGVEAVSLADASTGEVVLGTLSIDVTASLAAWANDPSSNFGWAMLMVESNAILFGSSEGTTPPKLTVTFGTSTVNNPPTVALENTLTTLAENTDTSARIKVADIVVTDDGLGTNVLSVDGADAALFEIEGTELYLKAGASLDYETNPVLDVDVIVDDPAVGDTPDSTASLAISITPVAEQQTVTFQQGVNGYTGTLDTDIRGDAPDNQYSTSVSVKVDGNNVAYPIQALLRFEDIFGSEPGRIPAGAQILSAQLELTITDAGSALSFYRMLSSWVETETWNTLGAGIQTDNIEAVSTPDASTGDVVLGTLSIDVTASLAAWVNDPSSNFGWAILMAESNAILFGSSEGTTPPKLTVTFTASAVNNPPTVALENTVTTLAEDADTSAHIKVADIVVTDDAQGTNVLSVSGADAALFEIEGTELYLKAGATLDYETNPVLDVDVIVDDPAVGDTPDSTASLAISITDVAEAVVYYVSQSGAGDGLTPEAPASIAGFDAGTGPFGALDGATIYFLGTITTTINPPDSGTAESRVILRGDHPAEPCTIDGSGTLAVGIDIGDDDYISVVGFTVQNTTTSAINVGSAATGTIIEDCTILQTAGRGIVVQSPTTITGNTLTATGGTQSIYSLLGSSGGTVAITGNVFNFHHNGSGLFIDGYGDHVITNNSITLSAGMATILDAYATNGETGSLLFSGNDIDSSVAPSGALVSVRYGDWAVTISDNTFDLTSAAFSNDVIYVTDLAGPTISRNVISVADDVTCVHLGGSGQGAVATITHNTLIHTGGDGNGYIIRVGEESISSFANTYDGAIITDNLVTGFNPAGNCHAVFVGFNRNAVIARNYISNAGYGIVVKGTEGTDYTAGGVMYNVIYNCDIGLRIKGVDDVVVANNTIYAPHALILTANVGSDESTGVVLKNNIFSGTGGTLLQIGSSTDLSTIDTADYATNCLYGYPPSDYVKYRGVSYTHATWVALGYDNGSINADPLFTNVATGDLTLASGSPCIDAGTNLGSLYEDGLDPLSLWPLSVNTLDQDDHGSGWEIGAYVVR